MIHLAWEGQLDTLRASLSRISEVPLTVQVQLSLFERDPETALALLQGQANRVVGDMYLLTALSQYSGWAHQMAGDQDAARAAFDSARVMLETYKDDHPEEHRVFGGLGFAYAGLGRRADAIQAADRFAEPSIGFPFEWAEKGHMVAQIYAQAGAVERAIEVLETLFAGPSYISPKVVEVDWRYDPVRGDPSFQALLERNADDVEQ
jgi:serine/threonine-protein kinase